MCTLLAATGGEEQCSCMLSQQTHACMPPTYTGTGDEELDSALLVLGATPSEEDDPDEQKEIEWAFELYPQQTPYMHAPSKRRHWR